MKKLNMIIAAAVLAVSLVSFNEAVYADDYRHHHRGHHGQQHQENIISREKAKQIAFKHAGVKPSQVRMEKLELDRDDRILNYDIEFRVGRTEYKYEINAHNGRILKYDRDRDDRYDD